MTRITRILPVLTFMISVAVLVLALWQVVGDAPWEDRVTEAKQWAVGPQGLKGTIGVIGP